MICLRNFSHCDLFLISLADLIHLSGAPISKSQCQLWSVFTVLSDLVVMATLEASGPSPRDSSGRRPKAATEKSLGETVPEAS